MSNKRRVQIENAILYLILMTGFMACGGCIGIFIGMMEKQSGEQSDFIKIILRGILGLCILFLTYYLNMYLHEVGHMLFGLMTGYRFSSLRFGKLMFVKSEGKLKIKKYSLAGTGGQALMLPPPGDPYEYPVFWYNADGLVMNLLICVLGGLGYLAAAKELVYLRIFFISCVLTGAITFVTNALPFVAMGTDGANIAILMKDQNARFVFRNTLELVKYLSDGVPLKDMPESLFYYDKSMKMNNPLVAAQAINQFSYYVMKKNFGEAYELGQYILNHAEVMNQLHEMDLRVEMLYLRVVHKGDYEGAKRRYQEEGKMLKKISSLMAYQRSLYAYYKLAEPDEKKASECLKTFEAIAKHYPYPEDVKAERSLLEYVDTIFDQNRGEE